DAHDAGRTTGGIDRGEVADERAGMRAGGAETACALSDREQHDGLAGLLRGTRERAPVAKVLDVERDQVRAVVSRELLEQLGRFEIGLIAERREAREAEPFAVGEQPELEREVAALRDQPDRAGRKVNPRREVELRISVVDAEAVRAEEQRPGRA